MKDTKFHLEKSPNCVKLKSSNVVHIVLSAQNISSGVEIRSLCGKIFPIDESQIGEKLEGEKCSSCYYYEIKSDKDKKSKD
ncbi:MAG: hypothetical protein OIN87_04175 [Candidatus Methanoperedens sp.]|nr:hypothetical protein [Candidatus Methanoperedens sp.]